MSDSDKIAMMKLLSGETNILDQVKTYYGGNHFSTKLEARWAVFFNCIGLPFSYEAPHEAGEINYQASFIAPTVTPNDETGKWEPSTQSFRILVKSSEPTRVELEEAALISHISGSPIVILAGAIGATQYTGHLIKRLNPTKFTEKESELDIVLRLSDSWIVHSELTAQAIEALLSTLSYGGLWAFNEVFADYEAAYRIANKYQFGTPERESNRPIRKYFSEFAVNMFGSYQVLLQQDQLDSLQHHELGSNYPCHIYMIARRPRIMLNPESVVFTDDWVTGTFTVQRAAAMESHQFKARNYLGSPNVRLESLFPHNEYKIFNEHEEVIAGGNSALLLSSLGDFSSLLALEVLYIGQSYGVEGAKSAPERLKNHSTLQGIYAEAVKRTPDQEIWLLLWSFEPLLLTSFDGSRQSYGTTMEEDDLHIHEVIHTGITEQQQINFTEAALIRYFEPEYNKTFKNSFPNPAHKTYSECYSLDINAVCVELQTEEIRVQLWSPKVPPEWIHIARFPLHSREDRQSIFDF